MALGFAASALLVIVVPLTFWGGTETGRIGALPEGQVLVGLILPLALIFLATVAGQLQKWIDETHGLAEDD